MMMMNLQEENVMYWCERRMNQKVLMMNPVTIINENIFILPKNMSESLWWFENFRSIAYGYTSKDRIKIMIIENLKKIKLKYSFILILFNKNRNSINGKIRSDRNDINLPMITPMTLPAITDTKPNHPIFV